MKTTKEERDRWRAAAVHLEGHRNGIYPEDLHRLLDDADRCAELEAQHVDAFARHKRAGLPPPVTEALGGPLPPGHPGRPERIAELEQALREADEIRHRLRGAMKHASWEYDARSLVDSLKKPCMVIYK